jgi:hypothetical protein
MGTGMLSDPPHKERELFAGLSMCSQETPNFIMAAKKMKIERAISQGFKHESGFQSGEAFEERMI